MNNYVVYHLHSDLSNAVTNIDSVTKYGEYIARAKECGMAALGFAEHGSIMEWWHKKCDIEAAGMKYIHGIEVYVTCTMEEKIRDNMHCVLMAKNLDGVMELNRLVSKSFTRTDNHFYYYPRISMDELFATSENIIVTSACIGGIIAKSEGDQLDKFLSFMSENRGRCFLEIGHHPAQKQVEHNQFLYLLSRQYRIPLIAGTDTHCLNDEHVRGRSILQKSKNICFDNEDDWDLRFKTFDELVESYRQQGALSEEVYMEAIDNTNRLADMIEPFTMDKGTKYPHIYDDPERTFREKIEKSVAKHPYLTQRYGAEDLRATLDEEIEVYQKCQSIDFMLLETYMREWEHKNDIWCGPGRGSVSGSEVAYALGITDMDSKRFGLNFFRFMNPARVTNCDIDTDYGGPDRDKVKEFLLRDKMGLPQIHTSEIITFNTIAEKGAVRDVARALQIPLDEVGEICKTIGTDGAPQTIRNKYPELFEYVDIVKGTIVSVGTHPSGVLVSDLDIESMVGMCSTAQSPYPVSMLNMKELDDLMYVKLDILGLDNVLIINEACKLAGIERLTPDNVDLEDMDVWRSIRDDTTGIFQWSSNSAQQYIRKFMSDRTIEIAKRKSPNFSMLKWMSFGNGLLRPACASYRDDVAEGNFADNGFKELNDFLAPEAGHVCMQESIMMFLVKFCGYTQAESDSVRRAIAKKKGTETLLPEIERRFIDYSSTHYDISAEKCAEVIKPFLQTILDASSYAFSWNHSDAYSAIGYICGYLRYYYPYEFITAALNAFSDDEEQRTAITEYADAHNIRIMSPRFGVSKDRYYFNKERKMIAKGLASVKYMSASVANDLFAIADGYKGDSFLNLLRRIKSETAIDSRQIDSLIKIDYFQQFGNNAELLRLVDIMDFFKNGTAKTIRKEKLNSQMASFIAAHGTDKGAKGTELKSYTITDMDGLLNDLEDYIMGLHLPELPFRTRAQNQKEILGYVDLTTHLEADRRKIYILDVRPLKSKFTGKTWSYAANAKSIGSGKTSRIFIKPFLFEKAQFSEGDILYAHNLHEDQKGYWWLLQYDIVPA